MNTRILLTYIMICLLFTNCKKDDEIIDSQAETDVFEAFQMLDKASVKFEERLNATNGNPWLSIVQTGVYLETLPEIDVVNYQDSINLLITLRSGYSTALIFNELDDQGTSLYRGGGNGSNFKDIVRRSGSCSNLIENKKVLIYASGYKDFYAKDPDKLQRVIDVFDNSEIDFEVTLLKDEQCGADIVETFGDYGLVIIESHGLYSQFNSGIKFLIDTSVTIKTAEQYKSFFENNYGSKYFTLLKERKIEVSKTYASSLDDQNWYDSDNLPAYIRYSILINSDYIASLPPTPNTIIVGNMCYSGQGTKIGYCNNPRENGALPIRSAFMSLNPISYYCYNYNTDVSTPVADIYAKERVFELVKNLVDDGDTTGYAHLDINGLLYVIPENHSFCPNLELNFRQYGKVDYCYGECGDSLVDARDGQKYATVCIGEQTWMAENLNWAGAGVCYQYNQANCGISGRLYSIDEATGRVTSDANPSGVQGICPNGWHIPSEAEWLQLIDFAGGELVAGPKLKSTTLWPSSSANTDEFGFNLKPSGQRVIDPGNNLDTFVVKDIFSYTRSTSTDQFGNYGGIVVENGYNYATPVYHSTFEGDSHYWACRCVKD